MENALTAPDGLVALLFSLAGVMLALQYLKGQSETPKGVLLIFLGFVCLFLTKILFVTNAFVPYTYQLFIDLFLRLLVAVFFIAGGLQFKGVKLINNAVLITSVVLALAWAWNVVLAMGDGGLYVFSCTVALTGGFAVLGTSMWGRRLHNAVGFVLTGWICVFLAVYNLLINMAWGKSLFSPMFEPFLYIALMCGVILISNNLLGHTFNTLKQEVSESKERLRLMIQMSPFPIIISRLKDDNLMLINNKAGDLFGLDTKNPGKFKTVDYFADPGNRKELLSRLEKTPVVDDFEILAKPRRGDPFWLLLSARVIDFEHEIALYMAFQDITDRKKKELKLFDQATKDPLTQCYNRRQFDELSKKEVLRFERYHHPFCLFMIDADHFKNVNDTYGHAVGDLVLQSIADCLRRSLRETDIIARFGGEEFVVLLPETSIENAHRVTERLRVRFSKIVVKNEQGGDVRFTISTGVVSSDTTSDIAAMLKLSDECLYVAKENGRNRVVLYGPDGPDKDIPVPTGEDMDKVNAEPLFYFVPKNRPATGNGASAPASLPTGAGSPLDAIAEDVTDTDRLEDDEEELPAEKQGVSTTSLYDDDTADDTTYIPVSAPVDVEETDVISENAEEVLPPEEEQTVQTEETPVTPAPADVIEPEKSDYSEENVEPVDIEEEPVVVEEETVGVAEEPVTIEETNNETLTTPSENETIVTEDLSSPEKTEEVSVEEPVNAETPVAEQEYTYVEEPVNAETPVAEEEYTYVEEPVDAETPVAEEEYTYVEEPVNAETPVAEEEYTYVEEPVNAETPVAEEEYTYVEEPVAEEYEYVAVPETSAEEQYSYTDLPVSEETAVSETANDVPAPEPIPVPDTVQVEESTVEKTVVTEEVSAAHAKPAMPKVKIPLKMMTMKVPQMPGAMKMKLPKLPPKK